MSYQPAPIDTRDVPLPPELLELSEKLAWNVHGQWARKRMEKAYDRQTSMETIKVLMELADPQPV